MARQGCGPSTPRADGLALACVLGERGGLLDACERIVQLPISNGSVDRFQHLKQLVHGADLDTGLVLLDRQRPIAMPQGQVNGTRLVLPL